MYRVQLPLGSKPLKLSNLAPRLAVSKADPADKGWMFRPSGRQVPVNCPLALSA
jgi:hypothetical protein